MPARLVVLLVLSRALLAQAGTPASLPSSADRLAAGRSVFVASCATCHGQRGRGDGVLKTVPAPRDLTSGRFSFGTTKEAILRTVENGIPPAMPPHQALLDEAQRRAVVDYVLTLLPEQIEMPTHLSRLAVTDRALLVSGTVTGLPRALVVGLPPGFTVVLDASDLRIVGVRRGEFVDRTDWRGRGGSPLALLGRPWPGFVPPAPAASRPAACGELLAHEARGAAARLELAERTAGAARGERRGAWTLRAFALDSLEGIVVRRERVATAGDGVGELAVPGPDGTAVLLTQRIDAETLVVAHALCRRWDDATRARLLEELAR